MPNMSIDGLIKPAITAHQVALLPGNADYALQNAVQSAITVAALAGLFTVAVSVAPYSNTLVQQLIERLVNMGYTASLTAATTLTANW